MDDLIPHMDSKKYSVTADIVSYSGELFPGAMRIIKELSITVVDEIIGIKRVFVPVVIVHWNGGTDYYLAEVFDEDVYRVGRPMSLYELAEKIVELGGDWDED